MTTLRDTALKLIWQHKLHVAPNAAEGLPRAWQQRIGSSLNLSQELMNAHAALPEGMLRYWLARPDGHLLVDPNLPPGYAETLVWRAGPLQNCVVLRWAEVLEPLAALRASAVMLDILLGSAAGAAPQMFSEGFGATPELARAAELYNELAGLGYGAEAWGVQSKADYWAMCLALAVHAPAELNREHPLLERHLRRTLLSEPFWRTVNAQLPSS